LEKVIVSDEATNSLMVSENAPIMDQASKDILKNKEFLAIILKLVVKEYEDLTVQQIIGYIEADSISDETEVTPGRTNQNRIDGINAEFSAFNEKLSIFDVVFKAINPKLSNEEVIYHLYFDIEAQNDYRPGYPIEKRGIYYMSRMISSQIAVPSKDTNYGSLRKVYSIWICRENIPINQQNSVSVYEFANTRNSNSIETNPDDYDLMTMVILRLGNLESDQEEIIEFLNALFVDRDYEVLKKYIDFSKSLMQEVKKMSGLGESIFIEGREAEKAEIALSMYEKGFPLNQIAEILKTTSEKIEEIINGQKMLV
jgi:hypothetical protein